MKRTHFLYLTCILVGILTGCTIRQAGQIESFDVVGNADQFSTLEQISDYPFYEYSYPGDYGFDDYLKTGEYDNERTALFAQNDFACSCFAGFGDENQAIFGRNFDWYYHPILILFTQPSSGYRSVSMVDISYLGYDAQKIPMDDPDALLYAPYIPFDGMNEMGFAIGMMSIAHAEGGNDPEKRTIDSLELMRLLLDHAASVHQALILIQDYNVDFGEIPVHYLIADKDGHSALIEYINGEPKVIPNDENWQASTNFLISETSFPLNDLACSRYALLEQELWNFDGKLDMEKGMELLDKVSQTGDFATRWSVVYDLSHTRIQVAVGGNYSEIYEFSLDRK